MENTVTQRVNELRDKYKISILALSKQIKVNQTTLNKQLRDGGCGVSIDTVVLMLDAFPGLSAEWLLRGTGEMSMDEKWEARHNEETVKDSRDDLIEALRDHIATLKRENEILRREKNLAGDYNYPMVAEGQEPYVTR